MSLIAGCNSSPEFDIYPMHIVLVGLVEKGQPRFFVIKKKRKEIITKKIGLESLTEEWLKKKKKRILRWLVVCAVAMSSTTGKIEHGKDKSAIHRQSSAPSLSLLTLFPPPLDVHSWTSLYFNSTSKQMSTRYIFLGTIKCCFLVSSIEIMKMI